jgi:hypothetical protein
MDDYNESEDDKEKVFIQQQVEKVMHSAETVPLPRSNHYGMAEDAELFALDCME